jgi:ABC-type transport system involved in cytochrome bd biosynthesis fused ATPase/permease subunit
MEKGRVVQQGSHSELIDTDGPYKELVKRQEESNSNAPTSDTEQSVRLDNK